MSLHLLFFLFAIIFLLLSACSNDSICRHIYYYPSYFSAFSNNNKQFLITDRAFTFTIISLSNYFCYCLHGVMVIYACIFTIITYFSAFSNNNKIARAFTFTIITLRNYFWYYLHAVMIACLHIYYYHSYFSAFGNNNKPILIIDGMLLHLLLFYFCYYVVICLYIYYHLFFNI